MADEKAQAPAQAPAQAAAPVAAPKKKDPRFGGQKPKQVDQKGKVVVVEKLSKINMSIPNGTQLVKGKVVGLSQDDLDFLNKHHVEGYEDKFFDEVPQKKVEAPKVDPPKPDDKKV